MDDPNHPEKKKYNTQELLSLNVDRLKEYMRKLGRQAADPSNPPVFEIPASAKPKGTTRIAKTPSACRLLGLFEDPHLFVKLVAANDERRPSQRYGLERTGDFFDALLRMGRKRYDILILSPLSLRVEEAETEFTSHDFAMMIRGLMRESDVYFLAKKRWFVVNLVEGGNNAEKVDRFRALRDAYRDVPIVVLHEGPANDEVRALAAVPRVRALPLDAANATPLFDLLDALTYGSGTP